MFHNSNGAATETNNKLLCAHALLAKFADLNIANEDGDTPIIAALSQGNSNLHLIALLLNYGSDVFVTNKRGQCALSLAIASKNNEIIRLILTGLVEPLPGWAHDQIMSELPIEDSFHLLSFCNNIPSLYALTRATVLRNIQKDKNVAKSYDPAVLNQLLCKGEEQVLQTVSQYPATVFNRQNR